MSENKRSYHSVNRDKINSHFVYGKHYTRQEILNGLAEIGENTNGAEFTTFAACTKVEHGVWKFGNIPPAAKRGRKPKHTFQATAPNKPMRDAKGHFIKKTV